MLETSYLPIDVHFSFILSAVLIKIVFTISRPLRLMTIQNHSKMTCRIWVVHCSFPPYDPRVYGLRKPMSLIRSWRPRSACPSWGWRRTHRLHFTPAWGSSQREPSWRSTSASWGLSHKGERSSGVSVFFPVPLGLDLFVTVEDHVLPGHTFPFQPHNIGLFM